MPGRIFAGYTVSHRRENTQIGNLLSSHLSNKEGEEEEHSRHFLSRCCWSVPKLCPTLWEPVNCSTPDFPVLHYLPEFAETHVYWVRDAIQPSHPLSPTSPLAFNLSQHQGLFQWVGAFHHVAKVYIGASGSASVLPMNIQVNFL